MANCDDALAFINKIEMETGQQISDDLFDELVSMLDRASLPGWMPIESAPSAKPVLVAYRNRSDKWRIVKAVRLEQFQEECSLDQEGDWFEYNEEKDAYFTPAGWYEQIDNWGDFSSVHIYEGSPSHWMPLPAPPQEKE